MGSLSAGVLSVSSSYAQSGGNTGILGHYYRSMANALHEMENMTPSFVLSLHLNKGVAVVADNACSDAWAWYAVAIAAEVAACSVSWIPILGAIGCVLAIATALQAANNVWSACTS